MYDTIIKIAGDVSADTDASTTQTMIEKILNLDKELLYIDIIEDFMSNARDKEKHDNDKNIFYYLFMDEYEKKENRKYWGSLGLNALFLEDLHDILGYDYTIVRPKKRGGKIPIAEMLYERARFDEPVLVVGETGTGKEKIAHVIHKLSSRRRKPLEILNCAAIPEALSESELFGYVKGAFTGATQNKKGLMEKADKGVLFLDELAKMPGQLQAKLLRVLEYKTFNRLGDNKEVDVDVRFIAAVQPEDLLQDRIIPDLKYRLGFPDIIELPTVRERMKVDPATTVESAFQGAKKLLGDDNLKDEIAGISIDQKAKRKLISSGYEYPGNFRELISILKRAVRAVVMRGGRSISASDLALLDEVKKQKTGNIGEKNVIMAEDVRKLKLKGIIEDADDVKARIVRSKIKDIYASGKDLKSTLKEEGVPDSDYDGYLKKLKRAGKFKAIKELKP